MSTLSSLTRLFRNKTQFDQQHSQLLQSINFTPIFIIGLSRSGTSLLHQLLAKTGCFNYIKLYHVIYCDSFLENHLEEKEQIAYDNLKTTLTEAGLENRIVDGLPVNIDTPEEYGLVLDNLGYSLYLNKKSLTIFDDFCRRIQYTSTKPDLPLLLKNPLDMRNFMFIKQTYPTAKFIFVHRNPLFVLNSQIKFLRSVFGNKNFYLAMILKRYDRLMNRPWAPVLRRIAFSDFLGLGLRWMLNYCKILCSYYLRHINSLPESDYTSLKYEDLCQDPQGTLNSLFDFLSIHPEINPLDQITVQPRHSPLLPEIERNQDRIKKKLHGYFRALDY